MGFAEKVMVAMLAAKPCAEPLKPVAHGKAVVAVSESLFAPFKKQ
jgi:hypothetical protein